MKESLKTDAIEIPETIEIEMDSKRIWDEQYNYVCNAYKYRRIRSRHFFKDRRIIYQSRRSKNSQQSNRRRSKKHYQKEYKQQNTGVNQIQAEVGKAINNLKVDNSNALDEATLAMIEQQAAGGATLTQEQINMIIASADSGIDSQANYIKEQYIQNAKEIARATAIQSAVQAKLQTKEAVNKVL